MYSNNLEKLEYNKILEKLSSFCFTYLGRNFVMELRPNYKKEKVQKLLDETMEANNLIIQKGALPIYEIADISTSLKQLESNNPLSSKALLEIANILKLSRELKEYFYNDKNFETSNFLILDSYFSKLYSNNEIENKIFKSIIDENLLADEASSKLLSIRNKKKKIEINIKDTLNNILHSNTYSKAIMEQIVTIRNDRYVIPVKEEFRGLIKGFIHDISSSKSTIFVEPMQVFELNNNLQTLNKEENIEIEHILEELSLKLTPYIEQLNNDIFTIGKLDFIFAKANFSKEIEGICPILNDKKEIDLKNARHPFIEKEKVVPIDISIGQNYSSLIITGPNTGGKTVSLKTTGLLCLMAYSGLFIPAKEKSSIYVFDNIFTDIGDEQSIQESLSTFSAHITNIINIINNATSNSLILIDELGSGTDPTEGALLAISILEYFNKLNSLNITTTHYTEIKNYAFNNNGFENASFSFDIENLKPTYKLLIGVPGKSNAFAISKKLGLKEDILNRAKELLKDEDVSIEELLKNIYDDKLTIEKEKEEIIKNKNQIETLRKSLEQEKNDKEQDKNKQIEKAKLEAKNILLSAKEEANDIIKELNILYDKLKDIDNIDFKDTLSKANELRNRLNSSLENISSKDINNVSKKEFKKENLKVGMQVILKDVSQIATIYSLSNKKDEIQVQIGNMKMKINLMDIENIVENEVELSSSISSKKSSNPSFKSKDISTQINVIGQNIEEACFVIDKYLDDCALAKISPIRIVHGKGTGKLREGIHNFLKKHPHVKNFRIATFGEGEMGVTIVEIK